jgi:hypothetical protein
MVKGEMTEIDRYPFWLIMQDRDKAGEKAGYPEI